MLNSLAVYKIDLNKGRSVTKDDYISMSKFMFMQICQQAELSLHLSQYNESERKDNKKNINKTGAPNRSVMRHGAAPNATP